MPLPACAVAATLLQVEDGSVRFNVIIGDDSPLGRGDIHSTVVHTAENDERPVPRGGGGGDLSDDRAPLHRFSFSPLLAPLRTSAPFPGITLSPPHRQEWFRLTQGRR